MSLTICNMTCGVIFSVELTCHGGFVFVKSIELIVSLGVIISFAYLNNKHSHGAEHGLFFWDHEISGIMGKKVDRVHASLNFIDQVVVVFCVFSWFRGVVFYLSVPFGTVGHAASSCFLVCGWRLRLVS